MPERKLFSVGDLCLDVLQEMGAGIRFDEEHSLCALDFSIGGNAANFAVISSKLGLKPLLLSAIGKDFATPFIKKELSKARVSSKLIKSKEQNAFSLILVDREGDRAIQSVKNCLNEITAKKIALALLPKLKQQDIVFFGGFYHLKNFRRGFRQLLQKIKKKRATICFDTCFDTTGKWNIAEFLPFIDFLFTNEIELRHIAKGKTIQKRAELLLRKGIRTVVVKQDAKGATLFKRGMKPTTAKALKVKVVDTTAAGDAFNAGFVFGLMRNWSLRNCLLAGNFVAARKIQSHALIAPTAKAVERHVAINNKPMLIVEPSYKKMSKATASIVIELIKQRPAASIALPTGQTPKQLYKILAAEHRKGAIGFSKAKFFAVDEYAGLPQQDKNSFSRFLMKSFLGKVNARKKNIFLLDGVASNLKKECVRHEAAIKKHGIDLCLLGIGHNGHIAFNEPSSCSYGITRVVKLKMETRKVNGKSFPGKLAPAKALTIGLRTIRDNSRRVVLIASGKNKAKAIAASLKSKDFMKWPAVTLQWHKNVAFVVDKAAAAKL